MSTPARLTCERSASLSNSIAFGRIDFRVELQAAVRQVEIESARQPERAVAAGNRAVDVVGPQANAQVLVRVRLAQDDAEVEAVVQRVVQAGFAAGILLLEC